MHGKSTEVSTAALDTLLAVDEETVAVEERSRGKTRVRRDSRDANRLQRTLDAMVKSAGDTATREFGMSEEKVQVALGRIRSETCACAI